jgi:hypothetical protein
MTDITFGLRQLVGCFFSAFCCGEHGRIKPDPASSVWSKQNTIAN